MVAPARMREQEVPTFRNGVLVEPSTVPVKVTFRRMAQPTLAVRAFKPRRCMSANH